MLCLTSGAPDGLCPPQKSGTTSPFTGSDKSLLRKQNRTIRIGAQKMQVPYTQWTKHTGEYFLPASASPPNADRPNMLPSRLALSHPASNLLSEWALYGCPTKTGKEWTLCEITQAVERGPHQSALSPEALEHFRIEANDKVIKGQARLVAWDTIRKNPPPQLKVSPIAAIPHKSKAFRSILDLSFSLRLQCGATLPSVNDSTTKTAPNASVNQLGHALSRMIHAFAETNEDDKIFMAKWDVKDGFWRLDCQAGEEYNFAYVLPQPAGKPVLLVIPTSLQMGWIESPGYFCAALETSRGVGSRYIQTQIGSLPEQKFSALTRGDETYNALPATTPADNNMKFLLEVFIDDFMSLVIATSRQQLDHVSAGIMMGIHDVFPPDADDSNDPISLKKLRHGEGQYSTSKTLLGFDFDGVNKTLWLEESKRAALLLVLKNWIRSSSKGHYGIPFKEFESVIAKV
jgi:hypothetical protein